MEPLQLIPLAYYDLISRVLPGLVLVVCLPLSLNTTIWGAWSRLFQGSAGQTVINSPSLAIVLVLAYIAGQILAPISDWLERHVGAALFSSSHSVLQCAARADQGPLPATVRQFIRKHLETRGVRPKESSPQDLEMMLFEWYDTVRLDSPDVAARLTKIRAEYRMYSGICAASAATGVLHVALLALRICPLNIGFLISAAVMSIVGLWGGARMYKMFQVSVVSHYYTRKTL
jgi:hypothetical protein